MRAKTERRKFTAAEYHLMAKTGILHEDDRVELIEGDIVQMAPIGSRHAGRVKRVNRLVSRRVGDDALVGVQDPISLGESCEPEPDISLLRYRDDFYANSHPGPADIFLLIEVADSSLEYDRETKAIVYARHGIPELWIVNLISRRVEVYRSPGPDGYRDVFSATGDDVLSPGLLPQLALTPREILGF